MSERFVVSREVGVEEIASMATRLRGRAATARSLADLRERIEPVVEVARRWLDPGDPIRREALDALPGASPFGRGMWRDALELMFAPITAEALDAFINAEVGDADALTFREVIGQSLAGNVPAPAVQSVLVGCLAGCGQLVKTASEDRLFPALLARSIGEVDAMLGERIAVVHWPGMSHGHNTALAKAVDAVVAFGRGETIACWRDICAGTSTRLVEHGPRTSVELIQLNNAGAVASAVARDVAMYDQQGCLSPQQVYLAGSDEQISGFVASLRDALGELAGQWTLSRGREFALKVAIRREREGARVRRAISGTGNEKRPFAEAADSEQPRAGRFDFTLIGTEGTSPRLGPGGRTLYLTRVESLDAAVDAIAPLATHIQGVALGGDERIARRVREELGVPYICHPGELQRPPFGWRNDGVPPLRSLMI